MSVECENWRDRAERAEASLAEMTKERDTLKRHAKVDDVAFSSMNHFAVTAEMEVERLTLQLAEVEAKLQTYEGTDEPKQ